MGPVSLRDRLYFWLLALPCRITGKHPRGAAIWSDRESWMCGHCGEIVTAD